MKLIRKNIVNSITQKHCSIARGECFGTPKCIEPFERLKLTFVLTVTLTLVGSPFLHAIDLAESVAAAAPIEFVQVPATIRDLFMLFAHWNYNNVRHAEFLNKLESGLVEREEVLNLLPELVSEFVARKDSLCEREYQEAMDVLENYQRTMFDLTENKRSLITFGNLVVNLNADIGGSFEVRGPAFFDNSVTINGNLTVNGTIGSTGSSNICLNALTLYPDPSAGSSGSILKAATSSCASPTLFIHNTGDQTNFFAGDSTGNASVTGIENTGVGANALAVLTVGESNTVIGQGAGQGIRANNGNTIVGASAGSNAGFTGSSNVIIGESAGSGALATSNNVIVGTMAATGAIQGNNTIIGNNAGEGTLGFDNVIIGASAAGSSNLAATNNVIIGTAAAGAILTATANQNVIVGQSSATNLTSSPNNTIIGRGAGNAITTGTGGVGSNIIIGAGANVGAGSSTGADTNDIIIGAGTTATASTQIRIGFGSGVGTNGSCFIDGITNNSTPATGANPVYINTTTGQLYNGLPSSRRYKQNIEDLSSVRDNFMSLRPVAFNYISDAEQHLQYGLIAEEVEPLFTNLINYNKEGQVDSIQYHQLNALYIKMIQDLQYQIQAHQKQMDVLRQEIVDLKKDR